MISWLALDIDDTLSNTAYDWFPAMQKLFGDPGFVFDELHNYYPRINDIWQHEDAKQRILEKVHNNEFQKNISLVPWAKESISYIHEQLPFSCYITMRPQDVLQWTEEQLMKHRFPQLPIIARPLSISKEEEYKRKVWTLNELYQEWVTGIIDDQVKLLRQMTEHYPGYQWIIHIIGPMVSIETSIRYTVSDSWKTLKEKIML